MINKLNIIKNELLKIKEKDPIIIIKELMNKEYVNIHGPEHHFLDGASFLVAYKNCGGDINLEECLDKLIERAMKMPGAMCGLWGVCGSTTSIGASLAIINDVTPLSDTIYYQDDMEFTSNALRMMAKIGGPRCCKRNAFISLKEAVSLVNAKYHLNIPIKDFKCDFNHLNKQCIKTRCPFFKD